MIKKKLLLIFSIFLIFFKIDIQSQTYQLNGAIMIGKTEAVSYQLVYDKLPNNIIKGYSITDLNGKNEIKTSIEGTYQNKSKSLKFKERRVLYDKSKLSVEELCLLQVEGKFVTKYGKEVFEGKFKSSYDSSKVYCDNGTIILTSPKTIYEAAAKASKIIDSLKTQDSLSAVINSKLNEFKQVDKIDELQSGQTLNYSWVSDSIILEIWDDKLEDGDKVSIFINGSMIRSNMRITNKPQTIKYPANKTNTINILATSEGTHPPNTVKIYLVDNSIKNLILSQLKKNEKATINLKKK